MIADESANSMCGDTNDDFDDADFCKDVYEPTGMALRVMEIETAFHRARYSLRRSELSPHRTPIIILHLRRAAAPRFPTDAALAKHVCAILAEIDIRLRKQDLTLQQTGDRILVAFALEQRSQPKRKKRIGLRELLAQLP